MRLPISKVYRAFPELDQFSDEQCERFVARARKSISYSGVTTWIGIAIPLALAVCCVVQMPLVIVVTQVCRIMFSVLDPWLHTAAVSVLVWVGLPALAGLMARDLAFRRNLRAIIWRNLERIRCPHCQYSLLGQGLVDGFIRCPECGGTTTLQALGLASEADLIPPASLADELRERGE